MTLLYERLSDEDLIERISSGDSHALAALYDRYSRSVYGLALRMLANPEEAEEVVQDSFLRVWRHASGFRTDQGRFAAWLMGIARNRAIDLLRRRMTRPKVAHDPESLILESLADQGQDVEAAGWDRERRKLVLAALNELPTEQRQVIELAYFGGLSQSEIAERLDNPLGTIKTRTRLALQKLRLLLHEIG